MKETPMSHPGTRVELELKTAGTLGCEKVGRSSDMLEGHENLSAEYSHRDK